MRPEEYKSGDRLMLGYSTWQHPRDPLTLEEYLSLPPGTPHRVYGPSGPHTRYFVGGTVVANDRSARLLVIELDRPHTGGKLDVIHYEDADAETGCLVPYCASLPQDPAQAHARALHGEAF